MSLRRMFWTVLVLALVLRVAHVLVMTDLERNPLFTTPIMDCAMHKMWAQGVLDGSWPGAVPFFRAPLYIYFLAGLQAVFGAENRLPIQLVHALISALGAGLIALLAARFWSRRAGWLAGLIFACTWTSIYFAGELLIVTLSTTLNLLLVWLLFRGEETQPPQPPGLTTLFLCGLVWGLSAIARPNVLVLGPIIVWYLMRYRRMPLRSYGWLVLAGGLLLPILPVTAHNVFRGGDSVLIASQGGVNFYIGNNRFSDGRTAYVPGTRPTWQGGFDDVNAMAVQETGRELRPSEVDRHYWQKGLRFWTEESHHAWGLYAHKLRLLFASGERSNNKNIYFWRDRSPLLRWPIWLGWATILLLAVLGFYRRDLRPGRRFLLLGSVILYAASVYIFFINARFRLPILALLAVAAGGGLDLLVTAVQSRRWPERWHGPVLAGLLFLFAVVPDGLSFSENKKESDPFSWYTIGNGYVRTGRLDEARQAYRQAVVITRERPQPHHVWIEEPLYTAYNEVLKEMGRAAEALRHCRQWVEARPENVDAQVLLGDHLLQLGRADEAAAHFEVALRNAPDHFGARLGFAWILLQNGDAGAAVRRFEQLRREQENNVQAIFGSGLAYIQRQRWREAEMAFLKVLELQPGYWQALGNLAGLYDQTGHLDRAREAYRRLLVLRPDDERASQWLADHGR